MATDSARKKMEQRYLKAAQDYFRKLPLEHSLDTVGQARQRAITLNSLALVTAQRTDFQVFNELLVQYPMAGQGQVGQLVPDNMVVLHGQPVQAKECYDLLLEPVGPFLVLDYVSTVYPRKDYDDNMRRCERDLKVPYYMQFVTELQQLKLYRHNGQSYVPVAPDAAGHYALPEIDLTLQVRNGGVRYWYQGKLLLLPAELQRSLTEKRLQLEYATQRSQLAQQQTAVAEQLTSLASQQPDTKEDQVNFAAQQLAAATKLANLATQRVDAAEHEVARLHALVDQLLSGPPSQP